MNDGDKPEQQSGLDAVVTELHHVASLLRAMRLRCDVGDVADGSDAQADCLVLADLAVRRGWAFPNSPQFPHSSSSKRAVIHNCRQQGF